MIGARTKIAVQSTNSDVDPVGQYVVLNNVMFQVIGLMAVRGASPQGQDQDDTVIIPFTTVQKKLMGVQHVANITVSAENGVPLDTMTEQVSALLRTLGAEVTLVAPPTLFPVGIEGWPVETSYDLDAVLPKADVVMMLRVQRERMNASFFPTAREYSRRYGLDGKRMRQLQDHTIVMHPGPMVRGMEITADVADSDRSVIVEQVTNGVAVRMAVLYLLLGGNESSISTEGLSE